MDDNKTSCSPRVSIGLTTYNGEAFLHQTLDSILGQTFTDFELIISDNASMDNTQEICEDYACKDARVKYYRNIENLGMVPNLNRVFYLSQGEYFKWADQDDILAPDFVSRCVDILDNNPMVAVCFPKAKLIDEQGYYLGDYDPLPRTDSDEPYTRFGNLITAPDGRAIQSMGLIRKALLRKTILNRSYPSSDEVLMANLSLLGSFFEIPEHLIFYRIHPKQSTKGELASERARVVFVDSSLRGKKVLIKWPYLKDCFHVIHSAPLRRYQRIRCYLKVFRWLLIHKNYRSLTKDLIIALDGQIHLLRQQLWKS